MVTLNGPDALRAWMERSGRSYLDVSQALGISRPHLSHLVTGGRLPSLVLAIRIEQIAGIPVATWAPGERVSA